MKLKITVIEPDRRNAKLINGILGEKYNLSFADTFSEGYSVVTCENPDIIIIDPLYPKKEGLELIEELRQWCDSPIIAISSNGTERAAVTVLQIGADDFIRKPFFSAELEARIEVAVRRVEKLNSAKGKDTSPLYRYKDLSFDYGSHTLIIDKKHIHLTKNEYKIFELLCKNSGKVLTYDYILRYVWGPRTDGNTGILRVNMANLRKKIEPDQNGQEYIFTENGIGYRVPENEGEL